MFNKHLKSTQQVSNYLLTDSLVCY
ncbi:unnamed protein product [Larinioides sclopetarius]|uniref:Uncharacterized protein n=1 Tax=Larinioides sclopetarius TaxID=280406 RepID=A0AAV1YY30_9ARAC